MPGVHVTLVLEASDSGGLSDPEDSEHVARRRMSPVSFCVAENTTFGQLRAALADGLISELAHTRFPTIRLQGDFRLPVVGFDSDSEFGGEHDEEELCEYCSGKPIRVAADGDLEAVFKLRREAFRVAQRPADGDSASASTAGASRANDDDGTPAHFREFISSRLAMLDMHRIANSANVVAAAGDERAARKAKRGKAKKAKPPAVHGAEPGRPRPPKMRTGRSAFLRSLAAVPPCDRSDPSA